MKRSRHHTIFFNGLIAAGLFLVWFQNCSGGYKTAGSAIEASRCKPTPAPVESASLAVRVKNGSLNCDQRQFFHCEERVFGPTQVTGERTDFFCGFVPLGCVETTHHYFNTESARDADSVARGDFEPGGAYNRIEVICGYYENEDALVYNTGGEELLPSLKAAFESCQMRSEGR